MAENIDLEVSATCPTASAMDGRAHFREDDVDEVVAGENQSLTSVLSELCSGISVFLFRFKLARSLAGAASELDSSVMGVETDGEPAFRNGWPP